MAKHRSQKYLTTQIRNIESAKIKIGKKILRNLKKNTENLNMCDNFGKSTKSFCLKIDTLAEGRIKIGEEKKHLFKKTDF